MDAVIENAHAAGKWDWPDLEKPELSDYSQHVRRLNTSAEGLERYGSDLYLALGCGMGDTLALRALQDTHFPALEALLARSDFDKNQIEDTLQQTMLHLCAGETPRMLTYAGRASLATWLSVTTLRMALNTWPRKSPVELPVALDGLVADGRTPELQVLIENARPAFQVALESAISALPERNKTLLRLCFLDRLSIDAIGDLYGVHRATAARWISDVRQTILHDIQLKLCQELRLSTSEFDSLAFLIRSQLQLSLIRVFGAA